jgi:hypothetical protein
MPPIQGVDPHELTLKENRVYFIGLLLFIIILISIGVVIGYFLPH